MLFALASACALDFYTEIRDVKMHPDFWAGVFPTSVSYAAGLDGVELLEGRETKLFVELGSGTLAREFARDPLTGEPFSKTQSSYLDYLKKHPFYDVLYASWTVEFDQGLVRPGKSSRDFLTMGLALDGRWEIAVNPILQTPARSGYPFLNEPFKDSNMEYVKTPGTPDVSGNHQLIYMDLRFSGVLNDLLLRTGSREGVKTEFEVVWAPGLLNLTRKEGGMAEFFRVWVYANAGHMFLEKKNEDGLNDFSLGVSADAEFRYLNGEYVPEYAEKLKGSIWFYSPESMNFLFRGTGKLDLYGPQFLGTCIPRIYTFIDYSRSWGKYNNCPDLPEEMVETGSFGFHFEIKLFNALAIYYEIGEIFYYTGDDGSVNGWKHSDGLKISMELSL